MSRRSPEKLHRIAENKNDWDGVPDAELNPWQWVAKKTKGILTIGNTITLNGAILFTNGLFDILNGNKLEGSLKLVGGRGCDLADGIAADKTGTKGKIGRDFDPTVDGAELLVGAPVLVYTDMLPTIPAVVMIGSKLIDTVAAAAAKSKGREMNPTEEGKMGAFAIWGGMGSFMVKAVLDHHLPGYVDTILDVAGVAGTVGGTLYKTPATIEYCQVGFGPEPLTHHPSTDPI